MQHRKQQPQREHDMEMYLEGRLVSDVLRNWEDIEEFEFERESKVGLKWEDVEEFEFEQVWEDVLIGGTDGDEPYWSRKLGSYVVFWRETNEEGARDWNSYTDEEWEIIEIDENDVEICQPSLEAVKKDLD